MALLTPNVSLAQILQNKEVQKDVKSIPLIDPAAKVSIVAENALLPNATPVSVSAGSDVFTEEFNSNETSIYIVKSGDTISEIANMFDISIATILSANGMQKGQSVSEGDVLIILPFSGIEHTIAKGQTLKGIAALYKVDLGEILIANDIELDTALVVGDKLIIPGAEIPNEPTTVKPKAKNATTPKGKGVIKSLPSVSGYFKNPVPGARRTRGLTSSHRGVDLAASCGTPIHAAAAGKILAARMGYNGGFGNMVIIQHGNGSKTLYAHMTRLGTTTGAQVAQGELIGYVGNTGSSRGCHLHIEVLGAKNPF